VQELTGRERNVFSEWTITAGDAEHRLARSMRLCVGNELRKIYEDALVEPVPGKIADLLHRLETMNT
jgi:hypothetical protein